MKIWLFRCAWVWLLLPIARPLLADSAADRSSASPRSPRPESVRAEIPADEGSADYVLQPQDVLRVFVFQHDDLNKQTESVSISKENTISLPLIKTINLKGKTVRQAEEIIRDAYNKDYLVDPQVSVMVTKYAERTVNVMGAVNTPGRIQFPQERGLTIIDAITLAGGFNRYANMKKVKLTRKNADGGNVSEEVDVDAMTKSGGRDATPLQPGDSIVVPERVI